MSIAQEPYDEVVAAEFDRDETALILQDLDTERLPASLWAKLESMDLDGYSLVLGRNPQAPRDMAAAGAAL